MDLNEAKAILKEHGYVIEGIKDWFKKKTKNEPVPVKRGPNIIKFSECSPALQNYIKAVDKIQNYIRTNYRDYFKSNFEAASFYQSRLVKVYIDTAEDGDLCMCASIPCITTDPTVFSKNRFYMSLDHSLTKYNGLYYEVVPDSSLSEYKNILFMWNGDKEKSFKAKLEKLAADADEHGRFNVDSFEP